MHIGQVVVADVLGLGSDVVVTKNVGVANVFPVVSFQPVGVTISIGLWLHLLHPE